MSNTLNLYEDPPFTTESKSLKETLRLSSPFYQHSTIITDDLGVYDEYDYDKKTQITIHTICKMWDLSNLDLEIYNALDKWINTLNNTDDCGLAIKNPKKKPIDIANIFVSSYSKIFAHIGNDDKEILDKFIKDKETDIKKCIKIITSGLTEVINSPTNNNYYKKRVSILKILPKEFISDYKGLFLEDAIETFLKDNRYRDYNYSQVCSILTPNNPIEFKRAMSYIIKYNNNIIKFSRLTENNTKVTCYKYCPEKKYVNKNDPESLEIIKKVIIMFHNDIQPTFMFEEYYEVFRKYFAKIDRTRVCNIIKTLYELKFIDRYKGQLNNHIYFIPDHSECSYGND
jgi:hypothetical protein